MDSIKNSIAKQERDLSSIIVPCYNEEKVLPAFYKAASDAVTEIESSDCEFIFVDDGSRDRTGESPLRTFLSRSFYHVIGRVCRLDMGDGKGDFRMMNRAMADSVSQCRTGRRRDKMEFSLPVPLCHGRYPFLFIRSCYSGRNSRRPPPFRGCYHRYYRRLIRTRSGRNSASGLSDPGTQRNPDALPVLTRPVYVKGLYGKQETADLHCQEKGRVLTRPA